MMGAKFENLNKRIDEQNFAKLLLQMIWNFIDFNDNFVKNILEFFLCEILLS